MPKHNPNQRWTPPGQNPSPIKPEKPEISWLALWAEKLSFLRKILLDSIFLASLIFIFVELFQKEVVLYPIEIPKKLEESGYTGAVIAEKLLDETHRIFFEAQDMAKNNSWRKETSLSQGQDTLDADAHQPDIQVPGAGFTLRTLLRYLRQELGIKATYIKGEIISTPNSYQLTLRNISDETSPAAQTAPENDLQKLLGSPGGEALLKISNPSVLAIWNYHKLQKQIALKQSQEDFNQSFQDSIDYCLRYPPDNDATLAYYLRGSNLDDLKEYKEAITQYQEALALDPNYANAYLGWGVALYNLKEYDEAIEKFKEAIKKNPKYADAYNNWGYELNDLKNYDEAITMFKKAIKIDPKHANAYNNWGDTLNNLKKYDEAIAMFKKAIEIDPKYADAYNGWGNALNYRKHYDEAIVKHQKAVALDPNFAIVYNNWSDDLKNLKHYEEALDKIQKAVELDPNCAVIYQTWGEILDKLGKSDEAKQKVKKAKELDPTL